MYRVALVGIAGLLVILGACRLDQATAPIGSHGRLNEVDLDCQLNAGECSAILAGIRYLQSHARQDCKDAGNDLYNRYMAPSGEGFRSGGESPDYYMWVNMDSDLGGSYSGWVASDGYVNVSTDWWQTSDSSDPQKTGQVLAHEAAHLWGWDDPYHDQGAAAWMYSVCGEA